VHLADASQIDDWAVDIPDGARSLAASCWPGPLTLVLHRHPSVPDEVTGGRDTVAVRVPSHPLALAVLGLFGDGIAAPSANRFGRVSPTTAADVRADLADALVTGLDVVLDGGPSSVGVESTIIELVGEVPQLLRPGGLPVERVETVLGRRVLRVPTGPSRAPGMLDAHYAPSAAVRVVAPGGARDAMRDPTGLTGFLGPQAVPVPEGVVRLDAPDPYTADALAPVLYRSLRLADQLGLATIVVVAPDGEGLGPAVRDRLSRAAHRD
jgi:L-threonylcarbamoyladenylate synthase